VLHDETNFGIGTLAPRSIELVQWAKVYISVLHESPGKQCLAPCAAVPPSRR
jgi:hypothetical protein